MLTVYSSYLCILSLLVDIESICVIMFLVWINIKAIHTISIRMKHYTSHTICFNIKINRRFIDKSSIVYVEISTSKAFRV